MPHTVLLLVERPMEKQKLCLVFLGIHEPAVDITVGVWFSSLSTVVAYSLSP